MIIVRLLPPEPFLVGFSTTKVYSGPGSRHCHGINDNAHGGGRVAWVAISPQHSKAGYKPPTLYQHQNTLRLMLQAQAPSPVLGRTGGDGASLHHFIGMIVACGFLPGIEHCLAAFGFQSEALKRPLVMMRVGIASKAEGIARCGLPRST